jgi:hypothetical protein
MLILAECMFQVVLALVTWFCVKLRMMIARRWSIAWSVYVA